MELVTHKNLYLVAGRVSRSLGAEIAELMGEELGDPNLEDFANGEIHCKFSESILSNIEPDCSLLAAANNMDSKRV